MRVLYFAWVRQRIGKGEEELSPPSSVKTVADLVAWLKPQDEGYEAAFADLRVIRAAVNQTHVALDTSLEGAHEVAFFPPVTGG